MQKRIAVFYNISNKFINQFRSRLQSKNIDPIHVAFNKDKEDDYAESLAKRTLHVLDGYPVDVSVSALIVVGVESHGNFDDFVRVFFPAFRILRESRQIEKSQASGFALADKIIDRFVTWEKSEFKKVLRPHKSSMALLPVRNVRSTRFCECIKKMASFEVDDFAGNIGKKINIVGGNGGLQIGNLRFSGKVNDGRHPVRRCTDTAICDLKSRLRLGHQVPSRFEYDVVSSKSLNSQSFYLCDGSTERPPTAATHLNMRINDDFKPGF